MRGRSCAEGSGGRGAMDRAQGPQEFEKKD